MIRAPTLLLPAILLLATAANGQLPTVISQPGTLRIEFGGVFTPADRELADGDSRELGAPITMADQTAANSPLVADMATRIGGLLGGEGPGGSLGGISADLSFQRGVGNIGLALGMTERITAFANIPIVSIRTEARVATDATGATLGLNPVLTGSGQTAAFFTAFDEAISTLRGQIEAGVYAGDPELEAAAAEWFAESFELRAQMADLLFTEGRLSPVLPLVGTADADGLVALAEQAKGRFSGEFGVPFDGTPAFPTRAINDDELADLLSAKEGFAFRPFDGQPFVALGDVELGVALELHRRGTIGGASWSRLWLLGSGTLATGTAPRQDVLRDQGTGDRQSDLIISGIGELGRSGIGVRGEVTYRVQQSTDRLVRVGARDEFLRPASRTAPVTWNPGDLFTIKARPFIRLADHMVIAGSLSWLSRGSDSWEYVSGATPASGGDPATMSVGTAVSRIDMGIGLSYSHDGRNRQGVLKMPVEAGLSLERTVSSGSGLVPIGLTTRLWFRVSKQLFRR
jgi:hypothetical protein